LGALIAFEVARYLQSEDRPPRHLIVSGCRAPQLPDSGKRTYQLPDSEFVEELKRLKGTPAQVLADAALMEILLPAIRADFAMSQTYQYKNGEKLICPIAAYGGTEDEQTADGMLEMWCHQTSAACTVTRFPGDHFYLHSEEEVVIRAMSLMLQPYLYPRFGLDTL